MNKPHASQEETSQKDDRCEPPWEVDPFLAFTLRMSHASARDEDAPAALKAWAALARKYLRDFAGQGQK